MAAAGAERIDWVDTAKGLCIIFVVMVHAVLGVELAAGQQGWMHHVVTWARPFRMPDFFMISGLFLSLTIDRPWRRYLDRKVVHFAYFYVLWLTIQFAFKAPGMAMEEGVGAALGNFLLSFVQPFGTLWFIYILPIFFVVARLLKGVPVAIVLLVAAVLEILPITTGWLVLDEFCSRFVYFYAGYALAPWIFALADKVRANPGLALVLLAIWAVVNPFQRGPGSVVGPRHPVLRVALPVLLLAVSAWLVPSLLERSGDTLLGLGGLLVAVAVSVALVLGSTRWPLLGWQLGVGALVGVDVLLLVHGMRLLDHAGNVWIYVVVVWPPLPALLAWTVRGRALTAALWVTGLTCLLTVIAALGPGGGRFYLQDVAAVSLLGAAPLALAFIVRGFALARDRTDEAEQRTREEREARAALAERTRIAQEMHDVVAHHFSEVAVRAETAPYRLPDLPEAAAVELRAVAASAREAMDDLRRLLGVLGSPHEAAAEVPQPGLVDVEDLLQRARAAGTEVRWRVDVRATVPDVVGLTAYRVVAQALSNARQHAALALVEVRVGVADGALDVEVLNAAGVDHGPGAGLGLASLRDRVTALDGDLSAGPTDDGGWELRARLPLTTQEAVRV